MARRNPTRPLPAGAFEDYFNKGVLGAAWVASNGGAPGNNSTNTGTFSSSHIDLSQGMLRLKLTQSGTAGVAVTSVGGEISTTASYGYGTYEWVAKMGSTATTSQAVGTNVSGTISAMFNYATNSVTEIDFELEGLTARKDWISTTSYVTDGIYHIGGVTGTTSATIPTHIKDDIILAFAYRSNSTTAPTVPGGWTTITSQSASTTSFVCAWIRASAPGTASGTWTNATNIVFEVYRGCSRFYSPIGTFAVDTASSTTASYPTITPFIDNGGVTWQLPWVVGFGASAVSTNIQNAPTGLTVRHNATTTGEITALDSNGETDVWSAQTVALGSTARWQTITLELRRQQNENTSVIVEGLYQGFSSYKFVWSATGTTFYVNGRQVGRHTTVIPVTACPAFINFWGTDNTNFGGIATPGTDRYMYVSYFRFMPE